MRLSPRHSKRGYSSSEVPTKLQHGEAPSVEQKLKETERLAGDDLGVDQMKEDVRGTDQEVPGNLTGAHDEPRQEP